MVISHDARAYTHTHAKIERWGGRERESERERDRENGRERMRERENERESFFVIILAT